METGTIRRLVEQDDNKTAKTEYENNKQGKRKRTIVKKDREGNKNTENVFALNDKEVESIFDLLEEEKEI